jgi:hypothetical protein
LLIQQMTDPDPDRWEFGQASRVRA